MCPEPKQSKDYQVAQLLVVNYEIFFYCQRLLPGWVSILRPFIRKDWGGPLVEYGTLYFRCVRIDTYNNC